MAVKYPYIISGLHRDLIEQGMRGNQITTLDLITMAKNRKAEYKQDGPRKPYRNIPRCRTLAYVIRKYHSDKFRYEGKMRVDERFTNHTYTVL